MAGAVLLESESRLLVFAPPRRLFVNILPPFFCLHTVESHKQQPGPSVALERRRTHNETVGLTNGRYLSGDHSGALFDV